jgi:hypothetical protein
MDDSFAFRTTVPLRRQVDPRALKAAALVSVIVLGIGLFANWVVASERRSLARAERRGSASEVTVTQIETVGPLPTDADAMEAVRIALVTAKAAFTEHRTFSDASTWRLAELQPGYIFVDGPSTMPRVVSVASARQAWAAAAMGPDGTCYWIRATDRWALDRGTSSEECTGSAALTSTGQGW